MASRADHDHDHDLTVAQGPDLPWPGGRTDPTATTDLRNRYAAEMYRRFRALKGAVREAVVERDVFGLRGLSHEDKTGPMTPVREGSRLALLSDLGVNPLGPPEDPDRFDEFDDCVDALMDSGMSEEQARTVCGAWEQRANLAAHQAGPGIQITPPPEGAFAFPADDRKVRGFMEWLDGEVADGILGVAPGERAVAAAEPWQNTYIRPAYRKGVAHADLALIDADVITDTERLAEVFRSPRHADAAGLLFTRVYRELDGVTSAMEQEMARVLAEGMTQGHNPNRIARALNDRVDKIGLHRGRLIARTETIRAHNEGALNRYAGLNQRIAGVTVVAEHLTAQDDRVCEVCANLEGETLSIEAARGRIPVHPNCRCTWVPVQRGAGERRTAAHPPDPVFDREEFLQNPRMDELLDRVHDEPFTGGFTLNPDLTEFRADRGRIVTLTSRTFDANKRGIRKRDITSAQAEWEPLLARHPNRAKMGTFQGDDGYMSVDLNVFIEGNDELAEALGRRMNQQAIWDLGEGKPIMTGGTGEPVTEDLSELADLIDEVIRQAA